MSRGGDLIREGRRRAGLTQSALAEMVGTTQSAVARWERGGSSPSMDTTIRVLRAMGFDLDYMLVEYDDSDNAQAARSLRRTTDERLEHLEHFVTTMRELRAGHPPR
jgi:transcriptional regulator with XRE-family HTH domain